MLTVATLTNLTTHTRLAVSACLRRAFGTGCLLWMALLILIMNVTLIIGGTMADSTEFVGALKDNLVVEPHSIALVTEIFSASIWSVALLSCLNWLLFQTAPAQRAGAILRKRVLAFTESFFRPIVFNQHGSRAPPSDVC